MKEENLIFIISQPRSGSTYLQNLLSNNAETNTCSEPWILLNYANQIKPSLIQAKFDNKLAVNAFEEYVAKYPNLNFNKKQKEFILSLYTPMANGFKFVIDKTPRYWELLDEIISLFPKSKIVILKRHPIHVAKSMIKTWNILNIEKLHYFKRDLVLAPKVIHKFCENQAANKQVYTLTYEDLMVNKTEQVSKLYQWIGLEFHETVLDTSQNTKYKGKFGDPYQNSEETYQNTKHQSKGNIKSFNKFFSGYANYLGADFLSNYGAYKFEETIPEKTLDFSYFMHFKTEVYANSSMRTFIKRYLVIFCFKIYKIFKK